MNKRMVFSLLTFSMLFLLTSVSSAQQFDFEKLKSRVDQYTVIIDLKIEVSFGMHSSEQSDRLLGTVVSKDGLIIFNGTALSSDAAVSSMAGVNIKTSPKKIEVTTIDGRKFEAEYIGTDRFTKIGFIKIDDPNVSFKPVEFITSTEFKIGSWVSLYYLLPEYVSPPLAADIGMLTGIAESPEFFPMTVGFSGLQMTSVLYNEALQPVGVLGALLDPSGATNDGSGMLESFNQFGGSVLGIVTGDRLAELIADPPTKGEPDRGWLGITLQALTTDIADFWGLNVSGGIIVNDIVDDSPAQQGGLQIGDIIYQINGQSIEVDKEEEIPIFQRQISEMGPDATVEFSTLRPDGNAVDTLIMLVTLGQAPITATDAPEYEDKNLEFKVRSLVFADYMFNQLDPDIFKGVLVSELKQGGLAEVGGLQLGDVIQRINDEQIEELDQAEAGLKKLAEIKPSEIIFFVWRDNKTLFVNVKTNW